MKKDIHLDEDEKDLENAFKKGKPRSLSAAEKKKITQIAVEAAKNYMRKDSRINIRLSAFDLDKLKSRAVREGLPYQTYIASILHKAASGQLNDAL